MKRHRTQITVWPAITDLMTSMVVIAVLVGIVGYTTHGGEIGELRERVKELETRVKMQRDSIETLQSMVRTYRDSMETLRSRIQVLRRRVTEAVNTTDSSIIVVDEPPPPGRPSCLGLKGRNQPNSLMAIEVRPSDSYSIRRNPIDVEQDFPAVNSVVKEYIGTFSDGSLNADKMISHARTIQELTGGTCTFFVRLENGGVSKDELGLGWLKLAQYFGGLTNPSILY